MADDKNAGIYNLTTPAMMTHPNLLTARAFGAKGSQADISLTRKSWAVRPFRRCRDGN